MNHAEFSMRPREAVRLLGICARTLRLRGDLGRIPFERTEHGHRRYRPDDVAYVADSGEWPPPGTYQGPRLAGRGKS